jgi:hypothetical protein
MILIHIKPTASCAAHKNSVMAQAQRTLTLAFLRPAPDDALMNRLTARASKHGICHAELVFDGGVAFSIYHDQSPFLKHRTMSNPGYELVTLSVSNREYKSAYGFCQSVVAEQYKFDNAGLWLASVHPGGCLDKPSCRLGKTFCSKIITEALQFADVCEVRDLYPSATTPSRLYEAVKDSGRRMCHTVRPMQNLDATGQLKMAAK